MTDRSVTRGIPLKAIPPGINDARTRALVGAFNAMASELDFTGLLMRTGDEIPDKALSCALHDFSLTEFVGPDGLPANLARKLIDDAWALHEQQGTDAGVKLGQNLLGIGVSIEHWWQKEPIGYHDTHTITLNLGDSDDPPTDPLGPEVQQSALKTIEATKRWSQDTDLVWRTRARMDLYAHAITQDLNRLQILPPIATDLNGTMKMVMAGCASTGEVVRVKPDPITAIHDAMSLAFGGSTSVGEVIRLYPPVASDLESQAPYHLALGVRPANPIVTILPEGNA
ncbi:phage tail protein [uncultured Cohaesibacter sp.]|uniref:phage tail protein n=1 Tax=uncultured Cohaesibacter sp. TaxID=1002546 RepID=UPI0029C7A051|nr:phage tail protein [uncultured Cohaesibacter sp.]